MTESSRPTAHPPPETRASRLRRPTWIRGTAAALCLLLGGNCCCEGPPLLSIWVTTTRDWEDPDSGNCDWDPIGWGGTTEAEVGNSIAVIYQDSDDDSVIRTAIELYDGTTRIPLVERTAWSHACDMGCPSPRTLYLLDVPPGTYTLVHRASTGTGKPVHTPGAATPDPWTEFAGERALVTTLVLTAPSAP